MANYPVFTPQMPNIDIQLFPQAAEAGVKLGQAIPNPITSIIQGGIQGYKTALDFQKEQASINQINQQIETAKQEEDLRAIQIQNETAVSKLNTIRANIDAKTESNKILEQNQKLQTEYKDQQIKGFDLTNTLKINDAFGQGGETAYNNILQDTSLNGTFLRDPNTGIKVFSTIATASDSTDEQKAKAKTALQQIIARQTQTKMLALQEEEQADMIKAFREAQKDLPTKGANIITNMNQFKITQAELASGDLQTFPNGLKTVDPKTNMIDTSKPDQNLNDKAGGGIPGQFDMFYKGKRANVPVNETENEIIQKIKRGYTVAGLPTTPSTFDYNASVAAPTPSAAPGRSFLSMLEAQIPTFPSLDLPEGSPTQNPTPIPVPTPPKNPNAVQGGTNPIEQSAAAKLTVEAATNPDLKTRLIAKGLLAPQAAQTQNFTPSPTSGLAPQRSVSTGESFVQGAKSVFQRSAYAPSNTPGVEKGIVRDIITNPKLAGLDPIKLGIVAVESKGNPKASNNGAEGYFQLRSKAAKDVKADRFTEEGNIKGGSNYYDKLVDHYNGQKIPALMAYNIGLGVIDSAIKVAGSTNYRDIVNGLEYLKSQGQYSKYLTAKNLEVVKNYPKKVLAYAQAFDFLNV